jgi:glycosyltransferase involved in cell wall biosynthesis
MISVIIPSYRNPKCLDICLNSALENQHGENEIICILDGYVEESQHIVKKYKDRVGFVPNPTNQGMQHSLNVGVWNATNEYILIVNDDNVFPKDWDVILETDQKPNLIITPNQIERGPSIFNFEIGDFGGVEDFNLEEFTDSEPQYRKQDMTNDGEIFPFYMSKTDYMMVGGFDTIYGSPFICDWDFFLKLELAGKEFVRSRKLNFYHFGSVATKNGKEGERFKASEQSAANIFKYKWGIDPIRHPNNSHKPEIEKFKGINYE